MWGHILSAEPAPACSSAAVKNKEVHQKEEDAIQVSQSLQLTRSSGKTNIWTGTRETSPESEPPDEKRAKREGDREPEEGELTDGSDEEEEEKEMEGDAEECASRENRSVDGMEVIKSVPTDS